MFLGGVIVLIVGSGLHQMRKWALQAILLLLALTSIFSAIFVLNFFGVLDLFSVESFATFNSLILPVMFYCIFFVIYLFTVRHYFD